MLFDVIMLLMVMLVSGILGGLITVQVIFKPLTLGELYEYIKVVQKALHNET